jgi:hypothetical protein
MEALNSIISAAFGFDFSYNIRKKSLIPASRDKQLHFIQDLYRAEINIDTAHTGSTACPIRFQVTFVTARTARNGTSPNLVNKKLV